MEVQNKLKDTEQDARLVHRLREAQYNSQEENARMEVELSRELNQSSSLVVANEEEGVIQQPIEEEPEVEEEESKTIFVGNLKNSITSNDLYDLFTGAGQIKDVRFYVFLDF